MSVVNLQIGSSAADWYAADGSFDASSDRFSAGVFSGGSPVYRSAGRFTSVTIGNGDTINSAIMTFTAQATVSSTLAQTKLSCFDEDNAANASNYSDWDSRPLTSAQLDWDISATWTLDSSYASPSMASSVQEVVDRGGWSSGNALAVDWRDDGSSTSDNNFQRAYSYNGSTSKAPKLDIDYTEGGGAGAASTFRRTISQRNRMGTLLRM